MKIRTKRFNWRVSEQIAAQLAYTRRETGSKSWDEFFLTMLTKWNRESLSLSKSSSESQPKAMDLCFQKLNNRLMEIQASMETQEQLFKSVEQGQEQIHELMQRTNLLLVLALDADEEIQTKAKSEQDKAPSLRNSVINKVRARRG